MLQVLASCVLAPSASSSLANARRNGLGTPKTSTSRFGCGVRVLHCTFFPRFFIEEDVNEEVDHGPNVLGKDGLVQETTEFVT